MKQTSAEWLFSKLWNTTKDKFTWHAILEQAKEMEKQQITDAHIEGQRVFDKHPHTQWTNNQAEQYYNETYGSKGSDDSPKVENKDSFGEISDEEIEEAAKNAWSDYIFDEGNLYYTTFKGGWEYAIKWYREQLKQK